VSHLCRARFSARRPASSSSFSASLPSLSPPLLVERRRFDLDFDFAEGEEDDDEEEEDADEEEDDEREEDEEEDDDEEDEAEDSSSLIDSGRSPFLPYLRRNAESSFFKRSCISASGGVSERNFSRSFGFSSSCVRVGLALYAAAFLHS